MTSSVRIILENFLSGDEETAFYDLIELPGTLLADLVQEFHATGNSDLRALLVKAAWERKEAGVIPFLGQALGVPDELVWQQALDGLVAQANQQALEILLAARAHDFSDEALTNRFKLWLEEAIVQVESELRANT